ncbi:MAG: methyltransferase domain-containing protein [Gammaproteobacteria bacterium]|nr:methyltransferase domain-containing protein [Gammaproteobacteria bacterium]
MAGPITETNQATTDNLPGAAFRSAPALTGTIEELPEYLTRYYAWAYVWPISVWFFDHQPIINAILFGHYNRIMANTLRLLDPETAGSTLQIAAVYGKLTPIIARDIDDLHLIDAARIQLDLTQRKVETTGRSIKLARMHAEALDYKDDRFDSALLFLLLHEMPPEPRRETLREAVRVVRPGGHLVIAEYGELGGSHLFHRLPPMRRVLTTAEPFLDSFWKESLVDVLGECAAQAGKRIELEEQVDIFRGFYRVMRYRVS